ncbi:MAG: hypothetical protein AAFQ58_05060 [Pseudomonadota bacterium]
MSILPILGGAGASPTPPPSNDPPPEASDPPPNTTEPQDTAPPAPATESQDSSTSAGSDTSDPQAETARVSLLSDSARGGAEQSVVEAALAATPDQIEADARRFAEAAQQQQRLEMLLEAVSEPATPTALSAPSAEQEQAGPVETEGTPV